MCDGVFVILPNLGGHDGKIKKKSKKQNKKQKQKQKQTNKQKNMQEGVIRVFFILGKHMLRVCFENSFTRTISTPGP